VVASGALPLSYQWRHDGMPMAGKTVSTISIANLTLADAGDYDVVVTNLSGAITSSVVNLLVDPTFTKITTGPIVTDLEGSCAGVWGDFDKDGFPDLFVANNWVNNRNTLYHNEGGTNFSRVNASPFTTDYLRAWSAAWGDFDNDGWDDLAVACIQAGPLAQRLYHNNEGKSFTPVADQALLSNQDASCYLLALDYDRDGFLDLFVSKGIYFGSPANDCLFRNQRDGTFKLMTADEVGPIVADLSISDIAATTDYDNDGFLEINVVHATSLGGGNYSVNPVTWHYQGDGTFASTPLGLPDSTACHWSGDYDNDGWMDLVGETWFWDQPPALYRNMGGGGFSNVTTSLNMTHPQPSGSLSWGDYDNDGWLDLFCAGYYSEGARSNLFFHANGDGTFTQIFNVSAIFETNRLAFTSWVDYNSDGFLDLFIAAGNVYTRNNLLYRNNGNGNHWLKVKLDGRASNRSGIGARVRAQATVNGRTFWQLRGIGYGSASVGPNTLIAHFGLGDATKVTTLRIEWPSGIVQELQNVAADQFITVTESQGYIGAAPQFTGTVKTAAGMELSFTEPAAGASYILEASTDLVTWTKLLARTSAGGTAQFTDTRANDHTKRFYRLQVP
jgi:hypothetical protein